MNKTSYLKNAQVQSFIEWILLRIDQPGSFNHSYVMKKPKGVVWTCSSIYNAFEKYKWPFTCKHPINNIPISGSSFIESKKLLDELSEGLRHSIQQENTELCQKYCIAILEWGQVMKGNCSKIIGLGCDIAKYLKDISERLNPNTFDNKSEYADIMMSAGFTKIYSLIIDDFIIYDGRVGAALGLLVRKFCEEKELLNVPKELLFAYGNARPTTSKGVKNRRNSSSDQYKFPLLQYNNTMHTDNNLRANWLLKEIIDQSETGFKELESSIQLRAFESALFMIGYDVLQNHSGQNDGLLNATSI